MPINRRQLFKFGALSAGSVIFAHAAPAVAQEAPKFVEPTAQKPMLLCFNENPLGITEKAKQAMLEHPDIRLLRSYS